MTSKQDKIIELIVQLQMMENYANKYYDHPLGEPPHNLSPKKDHERYRLCNLFQVRYETKPLLKLQEHAVESSSTYRMQLYELKRKLEDILYLGEEIDVDAAEKELMSIQFDKEGFDAACKKFVAAVDLEIALRKASKEASAKFYSEHR
jgi:hypothetical protein